MRYKVVASLIALVILTTTSSVNALEYQITIIEPTGSATAYALNDYGQVTGYIGDDSFVWEDGVMTIIEKPPGDEKIIARAINNHGQVTGELCHASSAPQYKEAFLWENGEINLLGSVMGDESSEGYAINNSSVVVGTGFIRVASHSERRAMRWDHINGMLSIDTIENTNYSTARSINDSNEVVGYYSTTTTANHAFIYDDTNGMRDIGVLPGQEQSYGYAINNQSQVVGYSSGSPSGYRAFLYDDSNEVMSDLGTLDGAVDSAAYDISNSGVIVGRSIWADDSAKGCLWINGQIIDVNDLLYTDLDWTITRARSISDNGQIVGTGVLDGQEYAILLTPVGHLDYDNDVDLKDFAIFSSLWGRSDCNDLNNWCGNSDINRNGEVDLPDLGKLTEYWLERAGQ